MQKLIDLLEPITEVAVVNAMSQGAAAFGIRRPAGGTQTAKQELKKLIRGQVREDGTVVLSLNELASIGVAPLYALFPAAWKTETVRKATLSFLKAAPALDNV